MAEELAKTIIDVLTMRGVEEFSRYYGVYNAIVTDIKDPAQRGAIQIQVPIMQHTNPISIWVKPSFFGVGEDRGFFWPPCEGDAVKVVFDRGDTGIPHVYFGGFYGTDAPFPSEFQYDGEIPRKRGFISRLGNSVIFNDTKDDVRLVISTNLVKSTDEALTDESISASRDELNKLDLHKDGITLSTNSGHILDLNTKTKKVAIANSEGPSFVITDNSIKLMVDDNNFIELTSNGLKIKTSGNIELNGTNLDVNTSTVDLGKTPVFKAVLGEALRTYLNTHTHIASGVPTTPPVVLATSAMLSNKVSLSK